MPLLRVVLALVLCLMPLAAMSQEAPKGQPATDAPLTATFESIKLTHTGFIAIVAYTNTLKEPLQLTLTHPQEQSAFATDNLGNEYTLTNSTGIARRNLDPNCDLTTPGAKDCHSTFLLASPHNKVRASYQFKIKRNTDPKEKMGSLAMGVDKPKAFTISIGHYVRPAQDFNPFLKPFDLQRTFGFTATTTDASPK